MVARRSPPRRVDDGSDAPIVAVAVALFVVAEDVRYVELPEQRVALIENRPVRLDGAEAIAERTRGEDLDLRAAVPGLAIAGEQAFEAAVEGASIADQVRARGGHEDRRDRVRVEDGRRLHPVERRPVSA